LKAYLVNMRNSSVTRQLDKAYGPRVSGGRLHSFCVSNKDYWDNRAHSKEQALPFLQLSGIIALRKHCLAIVADSQLRILTTYVRDRIPALLGDVELWVQSGACSAGAEQKRAVRESLNAVETQLKQVSVISKLPIWQS
jgi:hypothetical protein